MEPLDIKKMLENNPKVDPSELISTRKKRGRPDGIKGSPTSPYRGRRAASDDRMNWTEISPRRAR